MSWPRSPQVQADQKAGEAEEPLLNGDAARRNGHDVCSDAAMLDRTSYAHATAAPDHADNAAAPGKRRMSPFAWLLLAAAVCLCLPLRMRRNYTLPHAQRLLSAGLLDELLLENSILRGHRMPQSQST